MNNTFKAVATGAVLALTTANATAGENLWVYAKGTDTRPQGSFEFKIADTIRLNKNAGEHYTFHDIHPEIEYGITDKLTVAAEVVIFSHDYDVGEDGPGPMNEAGDGTGKFSDTQFAGYELSMKYNVLSPYKDVVGLSVGASYERRDKYRLDGSDIDQDSIVGFVFLQKGFLDNTLQTVLNVKTEFENRNSPDGDVTEEELSLEVMAGISYRFAPQWFIGLEYRHQSDYLNPKVRSEAGNEGFDAEGYTDGLDRSNFSISDFQIGSQHQHGNYFGPTIHFAEQKWWATAGVLYQFAGGGSEHADVREDRNWDEHERFHVGLSYGYEF